MHAKADDDVGVVGGDGGLDGSGAAVDGAVVDGEDDGGDGDLDAIDVTVEHAVSAPADLGGRHARQQGAQVARVRHEVPAGVVLHLAPGPVAGEEDLAARAVTSSGGLDDVAQARDQHLADMPVTNPQRRSWMLLRRHMDKAHERRRRRRLRGEERVLTIEAAGDVGGFDDDAGAALEVGLAHARGDCEVLRLAVGT